jgi:hypothetical protein
VSSLAPAQEAKVIYDLSYKQVTAGGETAVLWLDPRFGDLAAKNIENDAVKVLLLTACDKSCENVADLYGKDSLEYLGQLRQLGRLGWRLGRGAEAQKSLLEARDVVVANAGLPLLDRLNVYSDLILVCQGLKDSASVKKYTAEMNSLAKH